MMGEQREPISAKELRELAEVRATELQSDHINKHWQAILRYLHDEAESGHTDASFPAWDYKFPDLQLWPNEIEKLRSLGYTVEEKKWFWQKRTVVRW